MPNELANAVTNALAPLHFVRAAWLFGSRVRGTARPDSDLDLAVAYSRRASLDEREAMRREIVVALADAVGPIGEAADVVDLNDCDPAVAFAAISEGILVVERDVGERCEIVSLVARRYEDDAPRRALFRRAARSHWSRP